MLLSSEPWAFPKTFTNTRTRVFAAPEGIEECYLLGDAFGYAMQIVLFVFCMGSLLLKWVLERPQRRFFIFAMDTSKQCVAAGCYHVLNMSLAVALDHAQSAYLADECAWYWTSFIIDCTFGLLLNYLILRTTEWLFGYESGHYGDIEESSTDDTIDWHAWLNQVLVFCMVICLSKLIVTSFLLFNPWVAKLGMWGTYWIKNPDDRLLFVMVITPTVMNTMAFWVTDEFIKGKQAEDHKEIESGITSKIVS